MLRHYLTVTLRHLRKDALHSLINILGLTVGLTGAMLIGLYVHHEWRYDQHHDHVESIYRVVWPQSAKTGKPMASSLVEEIPEVEAGVLMIPTASAWMMRYQDRAFYEYRIFQVAGALFNVFSIPLMKGDPVTALSQPGSVVLTESISEKYFGDQDPIGKQIVADDGWATLTVTGVIHDPVDPSHINGDMYLVPPSHQIDLTKYWGEPEVYSYVRLAEGVEAIDIEARIPLVFDKYKPVLQPDKAFDEVRLQPLTDIHFSTQFDDEFAVAGDISTLYLLSVLAISLLAIAVVNFMNLTTAHSLVRLKEIGVRKVVGARRGQLVLQFLGEAVVLAFLAGGLSLALVTLVLPWFSDLSGQALTMTVLGSSPVLIGLATLVLVTGLSSGSYTSIHLSSYPPLVTLRQLPGAGQSKGRLRQILVTAQFAMALTLIIGAAVLSQQIDYLQSRRIGLQPDQVLMIRDFGQGTILRQFDAMRQVLNQHPDVVDATRTTLLPGVRMGENMLLNNNIVRYLPITSGFVETFGLQLLSGEVFATPGKPEHFVVSRSTVDIMGWTPTEAVGQQITLYYNNRGDGNMGIPPGIIAGVVEDFQIDSLRRPIGPIVMPTWNNDGFYGATPFIKLQTYDIQATLASIEEVWHEFLPDSPFEYLFLDEVFAQLYRAEIRLSRVSSTLAVVSVLIALLGVFGLTAYMAERRTKEVGIRKVLGASTLTLVRLLSRDMVGPVLIANLIAWPLAYLFIRQWLMDFAYRVDVSLWVFIVSGLAMIVLTQLTVGYHAVKTARINPVETLRYE